MVDGLEARAQRIHHLKAVSSPPPEPPHTVTPVSGQFPAEVPAVGVGLGPMPTRATEPRHLQEGRLVGRRAALRLVVD